MGSGEKSMRFQNFTLMILAASFAVAGCDRSGPARTVAESQLTVAGPRDNVERFAKLQASLRPVRPLSPIKSLDNGRAELTVTLPAKPSGQDVVHITREALAAGLRYEFKQRQIVTTGRS
jgi:hypothetical protein